MSSLIKLYGQMIPRRCNQIGMASGKRKKKKRNILKSWLNCYTLAEPCWAGWRQHCPEPPACRNTRPSCTTPWQSAPACVLSSAPPGSRETLTSPASRSHWGHTADTVPSQVSSVRGTPGAPLSEARGLPTALTCAMEREVVMTESFPITNRINLG